MPNLSGALILQMPKPQTPPTVLPIIAAHPLKERRKPFDGPDWLFEMKYNGYRGLFLYIEQGRGRLISRNGRTMKRFGALAWALVPLIDAEAAILDGEIVTKDASGRPIFLDLMRRPNDASYVAFDLLWLDGQDLRRKPLLERKRALARILLRDQPLIELRDRPLIEEALYVADRGLELFQLVQDHDLEGIIAKRKDGAYSPSSPWLKILNPAYSQAERRGELFNRPQSSRSNL
jgi:bifunctional non-homologous end joining protein LigD